MLSQCESLWKRATVFFLAQGNVVRDFRILFNICICNPSPLLRKNLHEQNFRELKVS
jgi:hypothetical protein